MLKPPPPFHLRALTVSDLLTVSDIEKQSFPTPTKEKSYRYELTENQLAHYQALFFEPASQLKQLIGYAGYWLIADEIHISTIAVEPQWRGKHLGELLLLNMIFMAYDHEADLVTLEVRENNTVAQALYQKYRFEVVGRRKRYYRDTGEDAILMTVILTSNIAYQLFLDQSRENLYALLSGAQL